MVIAIMPVLASTNAVRASSRCPLGEVRKHGERVRQIEFFPKHGRRVGR